MLIDYKGKKAKLPDFLIVGAAKSGTTSLHYYLKQHPQVFMPERKELWFFNFMDASDDLKNNKTLKEFVTFDLDDYIEHFREAGDGQIIGEACPGYLDEYETAIANIRKVYDRKYTNLKIIIILRNPAECAWSLFLMNRRDGKEPARNFKDALKPAAVGKGLAECWLSGSYDYIGGGRYYEKAKVFIEEFRDVKVFIYEELCSDALNLMKELYGFLGVDDGFIPNVEERYNISGDVVRFKRFNALVVGRYPLKGFIKSFIPYNIRQRIKYRLQGKAIEKKEMPEDIKSELIERYYKDDILKLQNLIKKDLSGWLI